jgi:hypothetical protein
MTIKYTISFPRPSDIYPKLDENIASGHHVGNRCSILARRKGGGAKKLGKTFFNKKLLILMNEFLMEPLHRR